MLKIAICDDEEFFINKIASLINNYAKEKNINISFDCFFSGNEFIKSKSIYEYQVVFLDIHFAKNQINGIEIGKTIRECKSQSIIVYVSSLLEYAPQGYEVNAYRFLLKQKLDNDFERCMDDILKYINFSKDAFSMKIDGETIKIPYEEILYFESWKRVVHVHTTTSDKIFEFYSTLQELENQLEHKGFLRIQKSYIVNIKNVVNMKNYAVILKNGEILKASVKQWKTIISVFLQWKGII